MLNLHCLASAAVALWLRSTVPCWGVSQNKLLRSAAARLYHCTSLPLDQMGDFIDGWRVHWTQLEVDKLFLLVWFLLWCANEAVRIRQELVHAIVVGTDYLLLLKLWALFVVYAAPINGVLFDLRHREHLIAVRRYRQRDLLAFRKQALHAVFIHGLLLKTISLAAQHFVCSGSDRCQAALLLLELATPNFRFDCFSFRVDFVELSDVELIIFVQVRVSVIGVGQLLLKPRELFLQLFLFLDCLYGFPPRLLYFLFKHQFLQLNVFPDLGNHQLHLSVLLSFRCVIRVRTVTFDRFLHLAHMTWIDKLGLRYRGWSVLTQSIRLGRFSMPLAQRVL